MSFERLQSLIQRFREDLVRGPGDARPCALPKPLALELFTSMLTARHLDRAAHELRASGHEANVVLGRLTTPADPSLVHYRSAAFQVERARHVTDVDAVRDIVLSLVAARDEPASGGRHKVFGNRRLGIIPQTSTIASHLPRAVGLAFALERKVRLGLAEPSNSIVLASFGDASINHSTALGAFNAAGWVAHQNLPCPLLFVCEDNGLGISVRSPPGWVRARLDALPHLKLFGADGSDIDASYRAAQAAVEYCRSARRPAMLHIECVRLLGHAGSDVDTNYRSPQELEQARARDPVLRFALALLAAGYASAEQLLELDLCVAAKVDEAQALAKQSPRLTTRGEVMSALCRTLDPRAVASSGEHRHGQERMTLAQGINRALSELLSERPEAMLFGEDVAKKGGVYGVTKGLAERFGATRVFNTLLDEQTILGLALGASTLGLLPIPEIQYLAYLHNAEDQLRGEAATFRYFSNGDYENPFIVRVAGLGYQKGFGGHFHNDNSLAVLRDIPTLIVAVPARADDALSLFRAATELALRAGRVVVIVEPIALYHRRDLVDEGDGGWLASDDGSRAELGRGRVYDSAARDVTIMSYGNGLGFSLSAARALAREGVHARVLDLRWLAPLPAADILAEARATGRVLVVDECRHSGNVSEAIAALLLDAGYRLPFRRVTSADSFIPLGEAANHVLLNEGEIVAAARELMTEDAER